MFKPSEQSMNQALLDQVSLSCLYFESGGLCNSAVVLTKDYAVTTLHCIPEEERKLGSTVLLRNTNGEHHNVKIHGLNRMSDYAVFKKDEGVFDSVPRKTYPSVLDRYIVAGFSFGEDKPSVRVGHISSLSSGSRGFFYGESGGLPGYSGGGVYYARNGSLMGIARSSEWKGSETRRYGDVLEMISVQVILNNIELFQDRPFSV